MTITELELPFPPSELSPNDRKHWANKQDAKKQFKHDCYFMACTKRPNYTKETGIILIFHPPDGIHRDLDNMLASMKYGLDMVADAWKINDRLFRPHFQDWGPIHKPFGKVRLIACGKHEFVPVLTSLGY